MSYIYHDSPLDEHPPADVTRGENAIWHPWLRWSGRDHGNDTVFLLTWDDWGGFDDHVGTPAWPTGWMRR